VRDSHTKLSPWVFGGKASCGSWKEAALAALCIKQDKERQSWGRAKVSGQEQIPGTICHGSKKKWFMKAMS